MPTVTVPIASGVYKNVDGIELSDESSELFDAYLDDHQATVSRPGLLTITNFGLGYQIDGLFWSKAQSALFVVTGGHVLKVTKSGSGYGSTYSVLDLTGTGIPAINSKASITSDGTSIFIANGGRIIYTDGATATAYIADADAPTAVTHLAWLDGYLIANNSNGKFYWSDINASSSWNPLSFATAAGNPDNLTALIIKDREIYLLGPESLEIWENDGVNPLSRISGGFQNLGIIAPYSLVNTDAGLFWVSDKRRFVQFNGRTAVPIASQYDKELQSLSTISDCIAHSMVLDGTSFVIFTFPTANRTFVYNQNNESWSEWGAFNSSTGTYDRYRVVTYVFCSDWGVHVGGSRESSTIYEISSSYYSDDMNPIRRCRLTGHIDYGTNKRKASSQLRLRLKRGIGLSTRTPVLTLRWRNDNRTWSTERVISLGDLGNTEIVRRVNCLGSFTTRQYELTCSDPVPVIFLSAQEDLEFWDA